MRNLPIDRSWQRMLLLAVALLMFYAMVTQVNAQNFGQNNARAGVQVSAAQLSKAFASPQTEYQPWVYWFWNNGNLTKEGIKADLEAMHRVGINGVLIMEVGQAAPQGPVDFMSDTWREMFEYMLKEAEKNGIKVNMNNDPGWNGSGGFWIKPDEAMQILTWSETNVTGSGTEKITLPKPEVRHDYYRDIVVWAFPTPKDMTTKEPLGPDSHRRNTSPNKVTDEAVVSRNSLINLSSKMTDDGILTWDVPEGNWTVLRIGHTCKGIMVQPAPTSGAGLECDKLSVKGTDAAFAGQIGKLVADNKSLLKKVFVSTHIDSWENGSQNWTADMRKEYQNRRKYDVLPFLPVFAGYVIDSADTTERFLWDFRRTVSEMVLDNHVRRMHQLANQHQLKLSIEAYGSPCDHLEYAGVADEPMGEFWIGGSYMESCRAMASAAHVYGKPVVGAEVFTANDSERWLQHPGSIKALGDRAMCEGINRFVFHRYSFQPWLDVKPGLMMGPWGIHYERTQTWWELTPAWHQYLTRCQYMLRQGKHVADICYVEPEDSPQSFTDRPRQGFPWDQCGADAVLKMSVQNGKLVSSGGMSYQLLVLPQSKKMTPELLGKVVQLVQAGATVIGTRPTDAFGLTNYPSNDQQVQKLADQLWGKEPAAQDAKEPAQDAKATAQKIGERKVGKGTIVWGKSAETVLIERGVAPDFRSNKRLNQIHRQTPFADIYFVANSGETFQLAAIDFRSEGQPEIWHPETGKITQVPVCHLRKGVTSLLLPLEATESVFVVFRKTAPANTSKNKTDGIASVLFEGKMLRQLNSPLVALKVDRAVYGVLDDASATADVTEIVQKMVADGASEISVSRITEVAGDPKFGTRKTLAVDYTVGDRSFSVSAQDTETVYLGACVPRIKITDAKYGPPGDDARTVDVREKLQKIVDSGENHFVVGRLARGHDPAYMVLKTLVMTFECDGETTTWSGNDQALVDLEQLQSMSAKVKPTVNANGQTCLDIWNAGNYEITLASEKKLNVSVALPEPFEITGAWQVAFPKKEVTFDKLISWSDSQEEMIKYFSGTAVYHKKFEVPKELLQSKQRVYLDLGQVDSLAELKVNGKDFGILWKLTKAVDITDALIADKENELEIRVTNLWPNRLIGDEQLPANSERNDNGTLVRWPQWLLDGKPDTSGRETFCMWNLWKKDDALLSSGLIGPVRLVPVKQVTVE